MIWTSLNLRLFSILKLFLTSFWAARQFRNIFKAPPNTTLFNSNKDSPWQFISLREEEAKEKKLSIYLNLFKFQMFISFVVLIVWFHFYLVSAVCSHGFGRFSSDPIFFACGVASLDHLYVCRFEWVIMEQHSSSSCQFILAFLLNLNRLSSPLLLLTAFYLPFLIWKSKQQKLSEFLRAVNHCLALNYHTDLLFRWLVIIIYQISQFIVIVAVAVAK